jgi:hypothetical protein
MKGLYRGLIPSLMGIIPYSGIELGLYEKLRASFYVKIKE